MKKTILPALAMLIVAAVMLSTASYAWFAMNPTVEADGMQVNVKSESEFLLIQAIGTVDGTLQPSSFDSDDTIAHGDAFVDVTALYPAAHHATKASEFKDSTKWYTGEGKSAADGTLVAEESLDTKVGELDNYVMRYKYGVILSPGSAPADGLWVTDLTITDSNTGDTATGLTPIKVVIACDSAETGYQEFAYSATAQKGTVDLTGTGDDNENKITDAAVVYIYVYIYYNGNDSAVTSANYANLAGAKVTFKLTTVQPTVTPDPVPEG